MKVSLNWIKEYIDLSGISIDDIAEKLTISGLEVEEIIDQKKLYKNFVVGHVTETLKHPEADKLTLCKVFDGRTIQEVICGAPNVAKDQKIVLAGIGAIIPENDMLIKRTKIRGKFSEGMICSEKELVLGDDHAGIMVLADTMIPGTEISEALGLDDVILTLGVTPNRPDALSHLGIARELSAIFRKDFSYPLILNFDEGEAAGKIAEVVIENENDCPRYSAKIICGIKVGESPQWLKRRLKNIGLRPINNIVDITNLVLHETGQPLHAFDLDMLEGKKIIVKNAGSIKSFVTLDSKERTLSPEDLLICDAAKPVAIAGVMGGENSEISAGTGTILLESAYFNPSSVRRTSKRLGLTTDASYRFERGTDPSVTLFAAERAAALMRELAGGKIASGYIDVYPSAIETRKVFLRPSRMDIVLGYRISPDETRINLTRLGFKLIDENPDKMLFEIPTFRPDVEREIDLIEEAARISGYDKIPAVEKVSITLNEKIDQTAFTDNIREILAGFGLKEIITTSLIPKDQAGQFGDAIEVLNPQSTDMSALRTSLIYGALKTIHHNINAGEKNFSFFEIGNIFLKKSGMIKSFQDVEESEMLFIGITGKTSDSRWYEKDRSADIYDLLGYIEALFSKISLDNMFKDLYNSHRNSLFEYKLTKVYNNIIIGEGGLINRELLSKFDIKQDVFGFIIGLDKIKGIQKKIKQFSELLKYPKVIRDFAFVVAKDVKAGEIVEVIKKSNSALLKRAYVFDSFESESLGKERKSLAFRLEYYDESRTLKDEEVDAEFRKAIDSVAGVFKAELRGV